MSESEMWITITKKTRKLCEKALRVWGGKKPLIEHMAWHKNKTFASLSDIKVSTPFIRISNIPDVTRALRLYRVTMVNKKIVDRALREIIKKRNKGGMPYG